MSIFKVGQQVVWISDSVPNPDCKIPKKNEIVVLKSKCNMYNGWNILNYETNDFGDTQSFHERHFKPLQDISETTYNEVMEWIESGKPIEILN